ncbi:MAG: copper resistance D family protein [Pseudonocardiaceae bacterium]
MPRRVGPPVLAAATVGGLGGLGAGWMLVLLAPADGPAAPVLLGGGLLAARAVLDASGVAAVGLTLLPLLLRDARPRESGPALAIAHRGSVVAGAGWAAAAALLLWLQVAVATSTSPLDVPARRVGDYLGAAVAGRALVVAGLCGLAVAITGALATRRPALVPAGLPAVPAVLGMLALPVTGHAATAPVHELAVIAVAVHVAAAAAWVGGLGALAWLASPRRELLAATLPRYSRLATACLVAVAVSGVAGAALRLPSTAALLGTSYGWMVLGKGIGLLMVGLLGGRARARLLPAVAARRPVRLTGWLAAELAVMGAVIGLASVLAGTAPPT